MYRNVILWSIVAIMLVSCRSNPQENPDAAFALGWALGSSNAAVPGDGSTASYTIKPAITVVGLHGTLDITLNGAETRSLATNGNVGFTARLAGGESYVFTVAQRATFALDVNKRNWVSQICTVDSGATGQMGSTNATPNVQITCTNRAYIYDPNHGISYMRCSQGQTYRAATNDCQGTGGSAPYGANMYAYCATNDNACNDNLPDGENSTLVNGHLNNLGSSEAFAACGSLNAGTGTLGKTTWRVPRMSELGALLEYTGSTGKNVIDPALFPDNVTTAYWSASSYALVPSCAWVVHFPYGYVESNYKSDAWLVRCVATGA